jgi:phosphoglycerate dehydrogenase-like enzyme
MKVLVTELIWPEGLDELEVLGEVEYDPNLWQRPEELRERARSADALIVRNQTGVDATLLEDGALLKAVGRLGVGLDNIDLDAAKARGVPVVVARNANAVSVAEYVMAAVLLASRNLYAAGVDVGAGGWDRRGFTGSEVHGKTLGLVGVGEISRRVARRASAFGMRVVGHDPYVAPYDFPTVELGVELLELDALLAESDFISLHVPLTPGTRNLLSLEAFRKMKPNSWIINTARGGVVNENDLAIALDQGLSGGPCSTYWRWSRRRMTTHCSRTSARSLPRTSPGSRRRPRSTPPFWWPAR